MTPHPINLLDENGNQIAVFMPEGLVRLSVKTVEAGTADGVKLVKTVFGKPEGLPEFEHGTWIIVSMVVKSALQERTDLIVPADVVRNESGQIIGCKSFSI